MNVSAPFIHRPIATSLLGIAVMLGGMLGYLWLPVASLPQVDFPTIQVTTQLPGASPDTIASLVTAPLERQFGQIAALATMTSQSSFGISQITLQFDLSRDIDAAAQDVQSAINAAGSTLPRNLPYPPLYSKVNPADVPIITLALTSTTIDQRALSDMADTVMAPRLSRSEEHTSELQSHSDLHSFPTRRSSDLEPGRRADHHAGADLDHHRPARAQRHGRYRDGAAAL